MSFEGRLAVNEGKVRRRKPVGGRDRFRCRPPRCIRAKDDDEDEEAEATTQRGARAPWEGSGRVSIESSANVRAWVETPHVRKEAKRASGRLCFT